MRVAYEHQVDVVVVEHVLRILKPVVGADKILHFAEIERAELVAPENVENVSTAVAALRTMCSAHLL